MMILSTHFSQQNQLSLTSASVYFLYTFPQISEFLCVNVLYPKIVMLDWGIFFIWEANVSVKSVFLTYKCFTRRKPHPEWAER